MSEDVLTDDQSHYEISLTAGQAFVAFVLLLLSLAASFAFGLMIGKGQADERLVVRTAPAVVTEASAVGKKNSGTIVELGVNADDFKKPADATTTVPVTESAPATTEAPSTEMPAATATVIEAPKPIAAPQPAPVAAAPATPSVPYYAQLLSTGDKNTAETLAAKLIDHGFTSAYVERGTNDKGPTYRVRVKFAGEAEAHAAEPKLREYSKEVWITK
jgi:cell division protein FtsN